MSERIRYTKTAIVLHWIIALLMVINVALGILADFFPEGWIRAVIDTHKSIGIMVLGLAILRILWRISHQPPAFPSTYSRLEQVGAHAGHFILYLLMLALPLSGWMHDSAWKDAATHPMKLFGMVPWPRIGFILHGDPVKKEMLHSLFGQMHTFFSYGLYVLFVLHVGAVIKHQFFDKEKEMQRMWWSKSKSK